MMDDYFAHSAPNNPDKSTWHKLEDHLRQTAGLARDFASAWGAGNWGYLAGLWHDIGKYSTEFQNRIRVTDGGDAYFEATGKVDDSTSIEVGIWT